MKCFMRFGIPERFVCVKQSLYLSGIVTSKQQKKQEQKQKEKEKRKQQMAEWERNPAPRSPLPERQCRLQHQQEEQQHQQQQLSFGRLAGTAVATHSTGVVREASGSNPVGHTEAAAGGVSACGVGLAAGGVSEGLVGVAAGATDSAGGGSKGWPWEAGSAAAGCIEARPPKHLLKQLHERVLRRMSKEPQGQLFISQVANTAICFPKELLPYKQVRVYGLEL